jgi:hypothetical protein
MTQDEIIEMAKQTQMPFYWRTGEITYLDKLEAFAKLVAAKEREEIAQFIERTELGSLPEQLALHYAELLGSYATAIRARGEA